MKTKLKLYAQAQGRVITNVSYDCEVPALRDLNSILLNPLDPWTFQFKATRRKDRFIWTSKTTIVTMVVTAPDD